MTISVCMIVKNEEDCLDTCLYSLRDLYDELIIVDTGSTDRTKAIASKYTDKIYDYVWTGSFSDARNYSFLLATGDYIYTADADEELDEENRNRFRILKDNIDPQIDIVQMYYCNQLSNNTIYNYDKELRGKLYKRVRGFTFVDDIHEVVRTEPLVYDSDIEIIHRPRGEHSARDIEAFERLIERDGLMSERLNDIYAKELLISDNDEALARAYDYFVKLSEQPTDNMDRLKRDFAMTVKCSLAAGNEREMFKYALRGMAIEPSSELCYELGKYFLDKGDVEEAKMWLYNAAYESEPVLSVRYKERLPIQLLKEIEDEKLQS